ncbi:Ni(II)/Co(II)-binding transcriptional repressor RcnR [Vibrio mediterranei]|uniref:Transcriptional repressor RcnR n=2 Tax=Vibrio mediterranei TaxID=689 RepID=A0ABX5D8Z5_9VIBR|nr:Ni(II)/Co(II)-binding transcriptional repressor RcnR [Vibrio mediterranei]PRQ64791.1 transcriptional repressor RcnR [Vibrio mediterranei]
MSHTTKDKKKLTARVSKIQGQVNGLKKMLDEEQECQGVLQQISAIRGAVNGLMKEVIKDHLHEHLVLEASKEQRETDMAVVIKVIDSYIK